MLCERAVPVGSASADALEGRGELEGSHPSFLAVLDAPDLLRSFQVVHFERGVMPAAEEKVVVDVQAARNFVISDFDSRWVRGSYL